MSQKASEEVPIPRGATVLPDARLASGRVGLRTRLALPAPRSLTWAWACAVWIEFAVAALVLQVQLAIAAYPDTSRWGIDTDRILVATHRWLAGQGLYSDKGFLYSPFAVVAGWPAVLIPRDYSLLVLALVEVLLTIAVTRWLCHGSWLPVLLVLTYLPLINDMALGNVMVVMTAAMAISTFAEDRPRSGIALGLVAAAAPKPLLAPYFIWLLFRRRRSALGAFAAGVVALVLALALTGPTAYVDWVHSLASGTSLISPFFGNYGVSAYLPGLAIPIAAAVVGLTVVFVLRADENKSLVWVMAAAILASPYGGPYLALPLLLTLPLLRPWARVYALALLQPVTAISVALAGLLAVVAVPTTLSSAQVPIRSLRESSAATAGRQERSEKGADG
jgi:hypothetical protein